MPIDRLRASRRRGLLSSWPLACLGAALAGCFSSSASPSPSTSDASADDAAAPSIDASIEAASTEDAASEATAVATADASEAGALQSDAGDSTATVAVGTGAPSSIGGAASADGSAMLILGGGAQTSEPAILNWSHYEPATGWSAVAALPGATEPEDPPSVGMDGAGNAYVAWTSVTTPTTLNVLRYDHATQTWGAPQNPDPYTQALGILIAMDVNSGGDVFVLDFHMGATGTHDAYVQHYTPGTGVWTQELVLSEPNTSSVGGTTSHIKVSDTGNAVAAFSLDSTNGYVAATRSGTTWTEVPQASFSVNQIAVDVNDSGDVLIGYEDLATAPNAYQYDAATMTWSATATKLNTESESSRNAYCPLTANVSDTGDATLVRCFSPGSNMAQSIESYSFTKSTKTWAAVSPLPTTGYSFFVDFAFDSAGSGLAVYGDGATNTTSSATPVASTFETASGWSAQSAPLDTTLSGVPHAFLASNGRGWAAWTVGTSALKVKKVR